MNTAGVLNNMGVGYVIWIVIITPVVDCMGVIIDYRGKRLYGCSIRYPCTRVGKLLFLNKIY